MKAALVALSLTACATPLADTPDPPRIRCVAYGMVPNTPDWWVYLCTFTGQDSVAPPVVPTPGDVGTPLGGES